MTVPKYGNIVVVDCEARGTSPVNGTLTEFGAVHFTTRYTFHGRLFEGDPDPANPAVPLIGKRLATDLEVAAGFRDWLDYLRAGKVDNGYTGHPLFVSDNVAYDWQWISGLFDRAGLDNPFGHSGRRISDFWAGLQRNWSDTQSWKQHRLTVHDHNPVNDAMGNVEALNEIFYLMEQARAH